MKVIKKSKQIGFCYGVKRAIKIAKEIAFNQDVPKPIYLLGDLIHNHHISEYLATIGITILKGDSRLEMLNTIDKGTVIFTAHGVSEKVYQLAIAKHLNIIDATCPYVKKTFDEMKKAVNDHHDILFVGKINHPEVEAALELSDHIHLVDNDLPMLPLNQPLLCHQTTMSSYDVMDVFNHLKKSYPTLEKMEMICKVSEKRQKEIMQLANYHFQQPALIIIVGDKNSNNSTKLYEMAMRLHQSDVLFIDNIQELNFANLKKYQEIMLFGGTSTPQAIIDEIYKTLLKLDHLTQNIYQSKLSIEDYIK